MSYPDVDNAVAELKNTVQIYLALSGGDASGLTMPMLKLIDAFDSLSNGDHREATLDVMRVAYVPILSLAVCVKERLEIALLDHSEIAPDVAAIKLAVDLERKDEPKTIDDFIVAKAALVAIISSSILILSTTLDATYPDISKI